VWVVRELGRLVVRTVVIVGVTLVLAVALAVVGAGGFDRVLRVLAIAFGCLLLGMGAIGRGSNFERFSDQGAMQAAWGKIPGFDALKSHPDEPHLAPGPALALSGFVLIALGVTVF
jgi:hypothetical protein